MRAESRCWWLSCNTRRACEPGQNKAAEQARDVLHSAAPSLCNVPTSRAPAPALRAATCIRMRPRHRKPGSRAHSPAPAPPRAARGCRLTPSTCAAGPRPRTWRAGCGAGAAPGRWAPCRAPEATRDTRSTRVSRAPRAAQRGAARDRRRRKASGRGQARALTFCTCSSFPPLTEKQYRMPSSPRA
jgi:hypothetical protein